MVLSNKEASTYKLFIALNVIVILFAVTLLLSLWKPGSGVERVGNVISLLLILLSFLFYGKFKFTPVRGFLFSISIALYVARPGIFTIGVPLVPLLGLFLSTKKHNFDLFKRVYMKSAKKISVATFLVVYLILYLSKLKFGGGTANLVSILAIYIIALNLIFFREAFISTVLVAVVFSVLFTPGPVSYGESPTFGVPNTHQGNRSAVFLLLFLFSIKHIKYLYSVVIKKKYFVWFSLALIPFFILMVLIISDFMQRGKMANIYSDPRFQWFMPMIKLLVNEGFISFFDNGSEMLRTLGDGRRNPHNSFFYLLLEQYWLGLFKILIFFFSVFIIPVSAWLAIAGRASFDIFFLLGPQDIILVVLFSEFYNFRFKKGYYLPLLSNRKNDEKINT